MTLQDETASAVTGSPATEIPTAPAVTPAMATTARRGQQRPGLLWRRTTLRRATIEAAGWYLLGVLLALVPARFWPAPFVVFPTVLVARLALFILPPVWAAMRVVSTRREKMSRRFWRLGPTLALLCLGISLVVDLFIGEASPLGGVTSSSDLTQLLASGHAHLALGSFLLGAVESYLKLAIYFTIAVVCTRLANGGFLRFTMPAGDGRVTL